VYNIVHKRTAINTIFDISFWKKIFRALERIAGAALLMGGHWLLDLALRYTLNSLPTVESLIKTGLLVAFIVIYIKLLYDMVCIFVTVPWRKSNDQTVIE
jgi:hypothetical protein